MHQSHQPLKCGDPGFIRLDQIGGAGVVVEGAGLVLRDPDPDQIAAEVVPLRQTMQGLASEELLGDLALERDAVGSMLSCHGSSSENPALRSIPELPTCPAPGAHSILRGNWDRAGAPVPSARPCRDLVAWTDPLVELRPCGLAHLEVRSAAPVPHRVVLIPAYPA